MISADREWLRFDGALPGAISALQLATSITLPSEYINLLQSTNGGEGPLPVSPYNLCLDSAESATSYNNSDASSSLHPGLFVFGGDGGGTLLALDVRGPRSWPVVCFDPIDLAGSIEPVAQDFASLVTLIGRRVGAT
jgi:hypothetical protein